MPDRSAMHHSLTYKELPEWLFEPLLLGVISQAEAAEIFDAWLMTPEDATQELPPHLFDAAHRLWLWEAEVTAPRQ